MGRPDAGVLVVGIEEDADLLGDVAKGRGQPIAEQGLLGVVLVLVAAASGGAEVAEVAGAALARDRREDLGLLRCRLADRLAAAGRAGRAPPSP